MSKELNNNYASLLEELKTEISTARIRAHLSVNREMIHLYWRIGRQILARQESEGWGE
jgi:predicted nuclease of restriction endonuclease-like (RecB) superfamily